MSYKTYTTPAIVVGSRANNTSDKGFLLFTRDAGMLWAGAKSVREEKSRQRFALQDFSLVKVSLVRGKSGWRIGSVECDRNYLSEIGGVDARSARATVTAIIRLIRQFLHGEVSTPEIFADTQTVLSLAKEVVDETDTRVLDIFTFRFLHRLGYIAADSVLLEYITSERWYELGELPQKALNMMEKAKQASHL